MNESLDQKLNDLLRKAGTVCTQNGMLTATQGDEDFTKLLRRSWIDRVSIFKLQENSIDLLQAELNDGRTSREEAIAAVKSDRFPFADRWEHLIAGRSGDSELYCWNGVRCTEIIGLQVAPRLCAKILKELLSASVTDRMQSVILGNIGRSYVMIFEHERSNAYIVKAAIFLKQALKRCSKIEDPYWWGKLQNWLAYAFYSRNDDNRELNLRRALHYCRQGLDVFPEGELEWAQCLAAMGTTYAMKTTGTLRRNIEKAIRYGEQALPIIENSGRFDDLMGLLILLGNAWYLRIKGDRTENYEVALKYHKRTYRMSKKRLAAFRDTRTVSIHVAVCNNVANMYCDRYRGDRIDNVLIAIRYLKRVLSAIEPLKDDSFNYSRGRLYFQIAGCYYLLGTTQDYLEKAIKYYSKSLKCYLPEADFEFDRALTYAGLAVTYVYFHRNDRQKNVRRSLHYFHKALRYLNERDHPRDIALVKYYLGVLYGYHLPGDRMHNLDRALTYFQESCRLYRSDSPANYRDTVAELAAIHIFRNEFQKALEVLRLAAAADITAHQEADLPASRESEIEAGSHLYFLMAWCHAKLGDNQQAVLALEAGKTRMLEQAVALERDQIKDLSDEERKSHRRLIDRVRDLEYQVRVTDGNDERIEKAIKNAKVELRQFKESIRKDRSDFSAPQLDWAAIASLIPDASTAILEFNVTRHGTLIALITKNAASEAVVSNHIAGAFTKEKLVSLQNDWIQQVESLRKSAGKAGALAIWGDYILTTLTQLSKDLAIDAVAQQLLGQEVKRVLIVPHLALHVLPLQLLSFAAGDQRSLLMEKFEISFLPSLTLARHRSLAAADNLLDFVGIANPTNDLRFAEEEVAAVAGLFPNSSKVLTRKEADYDRVLATIPSGKNIHFACHSKFDIGNPYASFLALASSSTVSHGDKGLSSGAQKSTKVLTAVRSESGTKVSETFRIAKAVTETVQYDFRGAEDYRIVESPEGQFLKRGAIVARLLNLTDILYKLRLKGTRLVVLSACESGIVSSKGAADEYIGLPGGFLAAGAQFVVSSLWKLEDQGTALLMKRFYHNLASRSMSIPKALQEAQLWLRDETDYKNPFYWAAFQATGLEVEN